MQTSWKHKTLLSTNILLTLQGS